MCEEGLPEPLFHACPKRALSGLRLVSGVLAAAAGSPIVWAGYFCQSTGMMSRTMLPRRDRAFQPAI